MGQLLRSHPTPIQWKSRQSRRFSSRCITRYPQAPATASAITLQLPGDVEKEVVAKDGINKFKLFHNCGMISPESTSFGTLSFAQFSKGMDLVVNQPRAG